MTKRMLIDALHPEEARVVIAENNKIQEFDFVTTAKKQIKGNIYLAKITRVEPSLQAAFVEYGSGKQGFLPFAEIHPDYYQIPIADRKRLIEEAEKAAEEEARAEEAGETLPQEPPLPNESNAMESPAPESGEVTVLRPEEGEIPSDVVQAFPSFLEESIATHASPPAEEQSASATEEQSVPMAEEPQQLPAYYAETAAEPVSYSEPYTAPMLDAGNMPGEGAANIPGEGTTDTPAQMENANAPAEVSAPAGEEEVETLSDEENERRPRRASFHRRYKIQEVIKRNQIVLVQVIKEERGNKGVSLTTYVSLAGRYCVLMPNSPKDGGISRKIASNEDRRRLKQLAGELRLSAGMSAIIRTAGMDRSQAEIRRDFDYLVALWNDIREKTLSSTAPALVYEEGDIVKRSIRDMYNNDIDEIVVEGAQAFETAKDFMRMILPSHAPKVKLHNENLPLFYAYDVEEQMLSMHDPVVRLRSGGYIVVNTTEALIAIDVNSGRATGERNIEETASKTNLEAAAEIARQVRLRDLAGLIVIDFIDMMDGRNRRNVERTLKDALKRDRAKIQLGRISAFGLMEMSRQRLRPSISETNMTTCPHCQGRGVVRSNDSIAIQIIRALEKEASTGTFSELRLVTSSGVAAHLFNTKRNSVNALEQQYNVRIIMVVDESLPPTGFRIDKNKRNNQGSAADNDNGAKRGRNRNRNRDAEDAAPVEDAAAAPAEDRGNITEVESPRYSENDDSTRRPRRGRNRRGGKRSREEGNNPSSSENTGTDNAYAAAEPAAEGSASPQDGEQRNRNRNRNRRDRGRRNWRDRDSKNDGEKNPGNTTEGFSSPSQATAPAPQEFSFNAKPQAQEFVFDRNASSPPASSSPSSGNETAPANTRKGWWRRMVE